MDVATQETIPAVFLATITVSGLSYCFFSVAVITMVAAAVLVMCLVATMVTIAANGLSGLSLFPAYAVTITTVVVNQKKNMGGHLAAHSICLFWNTLKFASYSKPRRCVWKILINYRKKLNILMH